MQEVAEPGSHEGGLTHAVDPNSEPHHNREDTGVGPDLGRLAAGQQLLSLPVHGVDSPQAPDDAKIISCGIAPIAVPPQGSPESTIP